MEQPEEFFEEVSDDEVQEVQPAQVAVVAPLNVEVPEIPENPESPSHQLSPVSPHPSPASSGGSSPVGGSPVPRLRRPQERISRHSWGSTPRMS